MAIFENTPHIFLQLILGKTWIIIKNEVSPIYTNGRGFNTDFKTVYNHVYFEYLSNYKHFTTNVEGFWAWALQSLEI